MADLAKWRNCHAHNYLLHVALIGAPVEVLYTDSLNRLIWKPRRAEFTAAQLRANMEVFEDFVGWWTEVSAGAGRKG